MKTFRKSLNNILLGLCIACTSAYSFGADKALIIGIQEYKNPKNNLTGIQIDVDSFKQSVLRLGVSAKNIAVLMNEEATEANINHMFATFLQDVGPNDKVYVYFSGHGSQISDVDGDEEDNLDEFLVTYEFDHRGNQPGALTDDEFHKLLTSVPSNQVFAFIDACHSGTISRNVALTNMSLGESQAMPKFLQYPGMPKASGKSNSRSLSMDESSSEARGSRAQSRKRSMNKGKVNFVTLSATQDDEVALATPKGSFFTMGLNVGVAYAQAENKPVTPALLYGAAQVVIEKYVPENKRYSPSLMGNSELFKTELKTTATGSNGSVWSSFEALVPQRPTLVINTPKLSYKVDEAIPMSMAIPGAGYLYLLTVDQHDNATLLFPNTYNQSNKVKAGTQFTVNSQTLGFDLLGAKPYGKAIVVALISPEPLNLRERSSSGRDANGLIKDLLVPLNEDAARAVKIGQAKPLPSQNSASQVTNNNTNAYYAGKVVINVVQ